MNTSSVKGLCRYDEGHQLLTQVGCQSELEAILVELGGLVLVSDMPEEVRDRLIAGLRHLKGHVVCETAQLIAQMQDRLN